MGTSFSPYPRTVPASITHASVCRNPSGVRQKPGVIEAEMEVPDLKDLLGDGDSKNFDKEAFKLFETMEVCQMGWDGMR